MKFKKITALVLAAIIAVSSLTACGSNKPAETEAKAESAAQSSTEETAKVSGKLKLAIFQGGYGADYWNELIKAFNVKYPDVEIEMEINPQIGEMIRPKLIAGDAPDFVYLNQGVKDGVTLGLIRDKKIMPIDDVFESKALDKDEKIKDIILDGMLDTTFYKPYDDGKIYLAPFNTSPSGLIYNVSLFKEKGWKVPETWDEFFELGDIAKKEGRSLFTFPSNAPGYCNQILLPALASASGKEGLQAFFNYEEGSFSTPEAKQIAKNLERIAKDYTLPGTLSMNHTQSQAEMMLGKALFIPNGMWIENEMKDAPREGDDKFQFGLLPCLKLKKEDESFISLQPEQIYIPAGAKNPEAAKEFMKFIYTDESVKLFGKYATGIIAVKGAVDKVKEDLSPSMYAMASSMNVAGNIAFCQSYKAPPKNSKFAAMPEIFINGLLPMFNSKINSEQWIDRTEKKFAEVREDYKKAAK